MELREFHNGLLILLNIDRHEFDEAMGDAYVCCDWPDFRDCPWRWFIKADDEKADKIWAIMKARTK